MNDWDSLTQEKKRDWMRFFLQNGISDLSQMRKFYNEHRWRALDNVEYNEYPDVSFTRKRTGVGDIDVFSKDDGDHDTLRYPNGYSVVNPYPGENTIIYNPKTSDAQDLRLDALHFMPQDEVYDALNSQYRYWASGDIYDDAREKYVRDSALLGREYMPIGRYMDNEADAKLRNHLIEGTPGYIRSKRYYPDKKQLRKDDAFLVPYIDNIREYLITGKRPANVLPGVDITSEGYQEGGSIHIDPKNKGKLTETMRRTGKSKYELAHSKNPLTRKRAQFAINASHCKHDDGGQIFWDNNGQLNPKLKGKPTGIVGTEQGTPITMENVDIDLIGKDNLGNVQYMTEGNNYYFPGQYVVEYPVKPHKAQIGTQFTTYQQKPKESIAPFIDENAYYDDRYKAFNVDDYVDQDGNKHGYPVNFGSHSDEANNMIYETSLRRRINPLSESMVKIDTLDPTSDAYNIEYGIYRGGDNNIYYTLNPEAQDYFDHTKEMDPVKKAELMKILPKRDYIGGKNYRWKAFNMINGLTDTVQNLSQIYGVDPNVMAHRLMKEGFIDDFTNQYNNMSPGEQKRYRDEIWKYGQDGFENFGTDHISSLVDEGKVKFKRNVGYHPYTAINEKGELANTAMFDNLSGALEANAATLGYITNEMKKKGYSGNNLKSAVNAAYNMGLYNDYLTSAINSGRYNVPTYFQFGGLLDKSKFDNYALQAGLQGMRAGLPTMQLEQEGLAPYITSDANYGYVPYSQNYEVQENPKQKSTAAGKQQKRTKADKMAFVRESFDNWYDTFIRHGHLHEDAVRMSRFFALQDSFESGYGNESSRKNNNFGGMNNVKEAKKQGVHYVPLKYKTPQDYYEAKYSMLWKWPQVFDKNTVKIGQFESAVNSGKQQYAPKSHNPQYRSRLLGMTDAINEIDNYSMNYKPVVRQYGGVIRPFSYQPVPVVRYDNGGMQEYLW